MWQTLLAGGASLLVAVIGKITFASKPDRIRRSIDANLDLLDRLRDAPETSTAVDHMALHLADETKVLGEAEAKLLHKKFDANVLAVGVLTSFASGALGVFVWRQDTWWGRLVGAAMILVAAVLLWAGLAAAFNLGDDEHKDRKSKA